MDTRALIIDINAKNEIVRANRGRETVLAVLSADKKTLTWEDTNAQGTFRVSVDSFLTSEGITIETTLIKGQKPDVLPPNAPDAPAMHKMQGELTPEYLDWLMKWKPIAFQNLLGVQLKLLKPDQKPPNDPRDLWVREEVIRTDTRPVEGTAGGQYVSTKFKMKDQIIARRASHLTFTTNEIFRGDTALEQAEPYRDTYADLDKLEKQGKIEIVSRRNSAASAGSPF